jgi:hypothetical protein
MSLIVAGLIDGFLEVIRAVDVAALDGVPHFGQAPGPLRQAREPGEQVDADASGEDRRSTMSISRGTASCPSAISVSTKISPATASAATRSPRRMRK